MSEDKTPEVKIIRDEKGRFVKGHKRLKPYGQFVRMSNEIKSALAEFLKGRTKELPELWKKLTPREKARLFAELCQFVIPKQKDVAITAMTEPTKDAVAKIFDFTDAEEAQMWVEETRKLAFPKAEGS
jgi:hypothetical protein